MNPPHIGSCGLGGHPRIAAAISDFVGLSTINSALQEGVDILELRVDLFPDPASRQIDAYLEQLRPRPVLLTIRRPEEGGRWPANESARLNRYLQLIPLADAVDVECRASIAAEVIRTAKQLGRTAIASFHDFQTTPDPSELDRLVDAFPATGADILKIAVWCRDQEDLRRLAAFLCSRRSPPMIVIGVGPAGRPARLLFPFLGSLVTYTYLGAASAPGQLNHRELAILLEQIRGGTAEKDAS